MTNKIIELKCVDCTKLDKYQFVVTFTSDSEKYQMTFHENVPNNTVIRINTYYHTIQKFDDCFRISIKQDYVSKETPTILDLFLADKYETKNKEQISVYRDSNTLEIFKMIEKGDNLKLNSNRLINLKSENLIIMKEPHIFNGYYVIENWIHQFGKVKA
jgi:hypothetical protein